MRLFFALTFIFSYVSTHCQEDVEINRILDSIVREADILYNYEKSIWQASDHLRTKKDLAQRTGMYVVYHQEDTIKVVFAENEKNVFATYDFVRNSYHIPPKVDYVERDVTSIEKEMISAKNNFIATVNSNIATYEISFFDNYSPNLVQTITENGFNMYIIMGTSLNDVIPIGGDMLFELDKEGNILKWKKFHKTLIPAKTKFEDDKILISIVHSHLPMTPYISATDICTFRLYGKDLFDLNEIQVLSTALNMIFTYNAETDKVTFEKSKNPKI